MVDQRRILYLDSGNSRFKTLYQGRYCFFNSIETLEDYLKQCVPDKVVYACVSRYSAEIENLLLQLSLPSRAVLSAHDFDDLHVSYGEPHLLGVDRCLAMLAAKHRVPDEALLVVNLGTAVTMDLLTAQGKHLGGSISPGISLSLNVLYAETQRLPKITPRHYNGFLGNDTESCMLYGVIQGTLGLIESTCDLLSETVKVVLGGGDSELLYPLVKRPCIRVPELVIEGLVFHYRKTPN